jgi:predicted TIM-barrel fold metal-dependent hydrolase
LVATPELIEQFARPKSWQGVLDKYPKLRLNFSHFGGNLLHLENKDSWPSTIADFIRDFPNVYTDISYHEQALLKKSARKYFKLLVPMLNDQARRPFILFGTDWPATRHTWLEKDYLKSYTDNLSHEDMSQIAVSNPLRFLFPKGRLPGRLAQFYQNQGINIEDLEIVKLLNKQGV